MRLAGTSTTTKQGAHMKAARQLTSLFFPAALFLANPAEAAKPLIDTVIADPALTSITIGGSNLGGGLTVFLSGMATPLSVTSATGSQIVASLPAGLAPGSYAVRVQGAGNGNFDEFFATFVAPPSVVGGGCTSYANASATSGTFGPQVSVSQGGNYALSVKMVVNSFAGAPNSFSCSLAQSSASTITNLDQTFAFGQGELTVVLQATTTVPGPAQFFAGCSQVTSGGTTPPASYFNWKITAVCLPALVSPSP